MDGEPSRQSIRTWQTGGVQVSNPDLKQALTSAFSDKKVRRQARQKLQRDIEQQLSTSSLGQRVNVCH